MSAARLTYRVLRWPLMAAGWVAWGVLIGLVCAVTLPVLFGLTPMTVLTGSMRPMIQPGDMVVDQPIPAKDAGQLPPKASDRGKCDGSNNTKSDFACVQK